MTTEKDTDIVRQSLIDASGNEMDIRTPFIEVEQTIVQRVRVPLYVDGKLKSKTVLKSLGVTIRDYTRLEVETAQYGAYYAQNPQLAVRVREYASVLGQYGLEADATSDQIEEAIFNDPDKTSEEKAAVTGAMLKLIHDIEINYNEVSGEGLRAWSLMPKFIRFLPAQ